MEVPMVRRSRRVAAVALAPVTAWSSTPKAADVGDDEPPAVADDVARRQRVTASYGGNAELLPATRVLRVTAR
jgi:hypothetical protein